MPKKIKKTSIINKNKNKNIVNVIIHNTKRTGRRRKSQAPAAPVKQTPTIIYQQTPAFHELTNLFNQAEKSNIIAKSLIDSAKKNKEEPLVPKEVKYDDVMDMFDTKPPQNTPIYDAINRTRALNSPVNNLGFSSDEEFEPVYPVQEDAIQAMDAEPIQTTDAEPISESLLAVRDRLKHVLEEIKRYETLLGDANKKVYEPIGSDDSNKLVNAIAKLKRIEEKYIRIVNVEGTVGDKLYKILRQIKRYESLLGDNNKKVYKPVGSTEEIQLRNAKAKLKRIEEKFLLAAS
jgi:hypothetical protein